MSKKWHAPVYAFFGSVPKIEYIKRRKCHTFVCSAISCTHEMHHFIGTSDSQSTGNMRRHVRKCWGKDALTKAYNAKTAEGACEQLGRVGLKDRSITAAFEQSGNRKVRYSHRQHMKAETK